MGRLLSHVAMYPSGARRRAGASSGRGIAIAVRDEPPRPRASIYAGDRDASLRNCPLDDGRLSYGFLEFSQVSALLCIFTRTKRRGSRSRTLTRTRSSGTSRSSTLTGAGRRCRTASRRCSSTLSPRPRPTSGVAKYGGPPAAAGVASNHHSIRHRRDLNKLTSSPPAT